MPERQPISKGLVPVPPNNPFAVLSAAGLSAGPADPPATAARAVKLGRVVLRRETAHRGGKTVTVVDNFPAHVPLATIETLASQLKKHCGCGGTLRERRIEIQGDQPTRVRTLLEAAGYQVAGVR